MTGPAAKLYLVHGFTRWLDALADPEQSFTDLVMPSFQEAFIKGARISERAFMATIERVVEPIMTLQEIDRVEIMKRGASPWLLRFLSGYMEKTRARAGPCIGDLLTSHWAKNAVLFIQGEGR